MICITFKANQMCLCLLWVVNKSLAPGMVGCVQYAELTYQHLCSGSHSHVTSDEIQLYNNYAGAPNDNLFRNGLKIPQAMS